MGVVSFAQAEVLPPLVGVPAEPIGTVPPVTRERTNGGHSKELSEKKALPPSHCKFILPIQEFLLRLVVTVCEA